MIGTYVELQAAIRNWLNKGTTLDARIPEFVQLAEARFKRVLDDLDQMATGTITLTAGAGSLPSDFGSFVSVTDTTYGRLEQVSASQFSDFTPSSGNPRVFAIIGNQIKTAPSGSGSVAIVYKLGLPPLASNTTNWLLTRAPDLYLFGSLIQAEFYGWNDERLPMLKSAVDEMIGELRADSANRRWGGAPIAPRLART